MAQFSDSTQFHVSRKKASARAAAPSAPTVGINLVFTPPATGGLRKTQTAESGPISPPNLEIGGEELLQPRLQTGTDGEIAKPFHGFCLSGVRVNRGRERGERNTSGHGEHKFADAFASMLGNKCGTENPATLLVHVNSRKAVGCAIEYGSVHLFQIHSVGYHVVTPLAGFVFVKTNVGDFRVGESTPGDNPPTSLTTT